MNASLFLVGGCLLMYWAFRRTGSLAKALDTVESREDRLARYANYGTSPIERAAANQIALAGVVGFAGLILAFVGGATLALPALYWLLGLAS